MRSLLFVHDGPMFRDERGHFYGIHINNSLIKRYLHLGDTITVLMRVEAIHSSEASRYSRVDVPNVRFVEVPDFKSIGLYFKNYVRAHRIIREQVGKHDVILPRLPSASGTIAALAALKLRKPILTEYVACTFDAYWNYNWKGKLIAHYKLYFQKYVVAKLPYLIYVTGEFLQKRYPSRAKQIACSNVEITEVNESVFESRIRNIATRDNAPLRVATIGTVDVAYKGQADVIQALHLLRQQGTIVHYYLVGQGDSSDLQQLVARLKLESQVFFLGPKPHSEIFNFLDSVDLYIQPSHTEGLPRAVIEAMSRACPVAGSRAGGIPELVRNDMQFNAGSSQEIAAKILKLDKAYLDTLARFSFEGARQYHRDILNERRLTFYKTFLADYHLN
ncbi:MAG TPA: glycosyltransferase family 4 protein [Chryseosolibacter sp.]